MTAPDRLSVVCIWLAWIAGLTAYPTVLMMVAQ
jgi:hypothetical protein